MRMSELEVRFACVNKRHLSNVTHRVQTTFLQQLSHLIKVFFSRTFKRDEKKASPKKSKANLKELSLTQEKKIFPPIQIVTLSHSQECFGCDSKCSIPTPRSVTFNRLSREKYFPIQSLTVYDKYYISPFRCLTWKGKTHLRDDGDIPTWNGTLYVGVWSSKDRHRTPIEGYLTIDYLPP